jgi:hypothetical protein
MPANEPFSRSDIHLAFDVVADAKLKSSAYLIWRMYQDQEDAAKKKNKPVPLKHLKSTEGELLIDQINYIQSGITRETWEKKWVLWKSQEQKSLAGGGKDNPSENVRAKSLFFQDVNAIRNAYGIELALLLAEFPHVEHCWKHPEIRLRLLRIVVDPHHGQKPDNTQEPAGTVTLSPAPAGTSYSKDEQAVGVQSPQDSILHSQPQSPTYACESSTTLPQRRDGKDIDPSITTSEVSHPSNVRFKEQPNGNFRYKCLLGGSPSGSAGKRSYLADILNQEAVYEKNSRKRLLEEEEEPESSEGKRPCASNYLARILHPTPDVSSPAAEMLSVANSPNTADVAHSNPQHTERADCPGCMSEDRGSTEQQWGGVVSSLKDTESVQPHFNHNTANRSGVNDKFESNTLLQTISSAVNDHPLVTPHWSGFGEARPEITYLMQLDLGQGTNDREIFYLCNAFWGMQWLDQKSMNEYDPAICYHNLQRSNLDKLGFAYLAGCIKRSDMWKREIAGDRTQCFRLFFPAAEGPSRKGYGFSCLLRCIIPESDAPRRLTLVKD